MIGFRIHDGVWSMEANFFSVSNVIIHLYKYLHCKLYIYIHICLYGSWILYLCFEGVALSQQRSNYSVHSL